MNKGILEKFLTGTFVKISLALFTLLVGGVTIYSFLLEKKVELQFEVIGNTNVFDIKAEVSKLDVLYDSQSLKKNNENLKILNVRIINKGNKDILKTFFDENDPVGILVSNGRIIEIPELLEASSSYITRNLKIHFDDFNRITFSRLIMEKEEFFVVKLLILHKAIKNPIIEPLGKIAGQKEINIINITEVKEPSFFQRVFYGSIWVQLIRLFSYFLGVLVIIVFIALGSYKLSERASLQRRIKILNGFKKSKNYQYKRIHDSIFDLYLDEGAYVIWRFNNLLVDKNHLNTEYSRLLKKQTRREAKNAENIEMEKDEVIYADKVKFDLNLLEDMRDSGIITGEEGSLSINNAIPEVLNKFVKFLKVKEQFQVAADIVIDVKNLES